MAFPLLTISGRQFKEMATGETGRNLLLLLDIKERQNTRELEISHWARGHDSALLMVYNSFYYLY